MFVTFYISFESGDPSDVDMDNGQIIGYASMILAFGAGFFGVRQLRDKAAYKWGFMKAWGVGLGIVLVGGIIYSGGWVVYAENNPDKVEAMMEGYSRAIQENPDITEEEKQEQLKNMDEYAEVFKNPVANFFMTLIMEPLPPGIIISLIIAIILRKPAVNQNNDQLLDENIASA